MLPLPKRRTGGIAGALTIDDLHQSWRIALAGHGPFRQRILNRVSVVVAQLNNGSLNILFKTRHAARTRDGYDLLGAVEKPCQSELRRRAALLLRNLSQAIGGREIRVKLLFLKTGIASPPIARRKIIDAAKPPAEESPAQRAIGH